jgi:hypothetical protein
LKIRLTPFNIVSAICLVFVGWLLIQEQPKGPRHVDMTGFFIGLGVVSAIAAFISDFVFRRFISSLVKLWIVEGMVVVFIVILIFIIKASI